MSSLVKEINRYVKHLLLTKTDVVKTSILSERKFEEMHYLWRAKRYIRGNVYFGIIVFSCLSSTKPCLRFLLICFDQEIKGFCQSSFRIEVDFTDIINVSPNMLAKNFQKLRHGFVGKRAMITTALTPSCHRKTLVPFFLRKKLLENAFLTLTVNYRKIIQTNKLCYSKQH